MVFKPQPCRTRWEGLVLVFWILLVDLMLLIWMGRRSVDWLKFILVFVAVGSLPVAGYLLYRTWSAFTLEYWVDRNAVTVHWGITQQVIPMPAIRRVIQGGLADLRKTPWWRWPLPGLGRTQTLGLANVQMVATRPLPDCLLLDAGDVAFAISPQDEERFLAALQAHYRLGPVTPLPLARVHASFWQRLFGGDVVGPALLGAGLAGVLLLFGSLMIQFPNLPDALAFHYNSSGVPDVVREKSALFLLPAIGLFAWTFNGLWGLWMAFHRQRIGAYMLWTGTIVVQLCSYLALTSLMN